MSDKINLSFFACVCSIFFLLLGSCKKDVSDESRFEDGKMLLAVGMPAQTKVAYDDDKVGSPAGGTLLWQDNDKLAVVGKSGAVYKKEVYSIYWGAGTNYGRFRGNMIPGANVFNIYYPSRVTVKETDGSATLDMGGQQQTGNGTTSHLRDYILLAKTNDPALGKVPLEMKSSIMKFVLENIPTDLGSVESLIWVIDVGTIKVQVLHFAPGTVNITAGQNTLTAYLSFMPEDMSFSETGKFRVLLVGSNKRHIIENDVKAKTYVPGRRYTAKMQKNGSPSWSEHKIALEYVAEYNLAQDGNSFAPDHKNNTSGYFSWYQTRTMFGCTGNYPDETVGNKEIDGVGYHFPSFWEWSGIIPGGNSGSEGGSSARVIFREAGSAFTVEDVREEVIVHGVKKQWIADYKYVSQGSTLSVITYGLRYKGHGNLQRSAWRYSYEDNTFDGSPGSKMIVMKALFLGPENPTTLENIANESFWTANASKVVTRIFPMAGLCWNNLPPPQTNISDFNTGGRYWSCTTLKPGIGSASNAYSFIFKPEDSGPSIGGANKNKRSRRLVRPFFNE